MTTLTELRRQLKARNLPEDVVAALASDTATDQLVPHGADEAARLLVDEGKHVHIVSEGHSNCVSGDCPPWTPRGEA